ncbi:hypothetical protein [Roseicyclus sp.]
MSNGLAIFLAICIAVFLTFDATVFDWDLSLSLARRFVGLLNWIAFWR